MRTRWSFGLQAAVTLVMTLVVVAATLALAACGDENTAPTDLPTRTTPVAAYSFPPQETDADDQYVRCTDAVEFVPWVDIEVTALGYYDDGGDGLVNVHEVGIFATSSKELVTLAVTIDQASSLEGGFRYETITPVVLKGGASYILAGQTAPCDLVVEDPDDVVWAPEVRYVKSYIDLGDFGCPVTNTSDWQSDLWTHTNFKFRTPTSPSPAGTP
jgi:hypothetical protein